MTKAKPSAGLAITCLPAIAGHDPIFAAIGAHRDAIQALDLTYEGRKSMGPEDHALVQAAISADLAAAKTLIATAPTTQAGLQALERHLREDGAAFALHFIERPATYGTISADTQGIDWLSAKRAAEIAGAA
jgi:hypothetical protein